MASGVARIAAIVLLLTLAACDNAEQKAGKAVARYDLLYAQRDYLAARIEISKAIVAQDEIPEYWAKLARVQLALGRYLDAYESYRHVIELQPGNEEANATMAELSYSGGAYEDAERFADTILKEQPRSLRMLIVKGSLAATRRRGPEAHAIAERILEIDPGNEGGAMLLARAQLLGGDRHGAIATMEQSIARNGETVAKLNVLTDLYAGVNDFRSLARTFARLFALQPGDANLRLEYVRILYQQGMPDRALPMLARLTRAHPGDRKLQQRIVEIWNEAGSERVDLEAVRRFVETSGDQQMKVALGHLMLDRKRYGEAEAVLRPFVDAGDVTAENVEADVLYAGALVGLGRGAEAESLVSRVLAFDGSNPRALLMRARALAARGAVDRALRDAQVASRDNPTMVEARIELGRIYMIRNEHVLADNTYARALNQLSQNPAMLAAYMEYQISRGRPKMAADGARRFTHDNPALLEGWRQRAALCIAQHDAPCLAQSVSVLDQLPGGSKIRRDLVAQAAAEGGSFRRVAAPAGQKASACGTTGAPC